MISFGVGNNCDVLLYGLERPKAGFLPQQQSACRSQRIVRSNFLSIFDVACSTDKRVFCRKKSESKFNITSCLQVTPIRNNCILCAHTIIGLICWKSPPPCVFTHYLTIVEPQYKYYQQQFANSTDGIFDLRSFPYIST